MIIVIFMDDIFVLVFVKLRLCDIFCCRSVSKKFNNISNNKLLWTHLHLRDYKNLDVIDNNYYQSYKTYFKLNDFVPQFLSFDMRKSINLQTELVTFNRSIYYIPTELCLLKNLTKICFMNHKIEIIPTEIGYLKKLQKIYLSNNEIRIIQTQIGLLKELTNVDMSNNYIKNIPTEIGMLLNLNTLLLNMNAIIEIPTQIGKLTNLRNVSFNINNITVIPTEIALLSDAAIYLNDNNIWQIPKELENKKMFVNGNFIRINNFVNNIKNFFDDVFG